MKVAVLVLSLIALVWAAWALDSILCTIGAFFVLMQLLEDL